MASGYCKYCGKYSENLLIGGYCSSTCQSNFDIEYNKQYYANLKAEREKQDQITRDKIKTGASVASAILLAEQNAILKQQQEQAQAQAIAEARAKQAKKEDLAKSYGLENAADAAYWINQVGEDDTIEDALKLKQNYKFFVNMQLNAGVFWLFCELTGESEECYNNFNNWQIRRRRDL